MKKHIKILKKKLKNYNPKLKEYSRNLRNVGTKAEACLWKFVLKAGKLRGCKFRRQRPVLNYIADFMCPELMLIIEVDGISHWDEDVVKNDEIRQKELEKVGVIDFHFHDVPQEEGWNQTVHVFVIRNFEFEVKESEEMAPKVFSFDQIPYDQMWKDDVYWLPAVLKGMFVRAAFVFDKKGDEIIDFSIYARDRERR